MTNQRRLYYAVYAAGIARDGTNTFTFIHGVQSLGLTTRFNLQHIFELGQLAEYQAVENLPEVEVTAEKCLDGFPMMWHLSTQDATSPTLAGRSAFKCSLAISYYTDTQENASGTPLRQCLASGMFPSSLSYNFPTESVATESVTWIGNDKLWLSSGFTFTPSLAGADAPPTGVQRRNDVLFGSGVNFSVLPTEIPGITGQGYNIIGSDGYFGAHVRNVRIQANFGRTPLYELGQLRLYFRTVDFPLEVRTDIEIYAQIGDTINCDSNSQANVNPQAIAIKMRDGDRFDLSNKNKLTNVSQTGGNAGTGGGNATITYSYVNFNSLTVTSPQDPAQL